MLRNATRELDWRRHVPQQLSHGPHIIRRFPWQRFCRQSFASHAAVDARREDDHNSTFDRNDLVGDRTLKTNTGGTTSERHRHVLSSVKKGSGYSDHGSESRIQGPPQIKEWSLVPHRRRRLERNTKLSKSWTSQTPNLLLKRVLEPNPLSHHWKMRLARTRSIRLPILLLQMMIRKEISQQPDQKELLDLLPSPKKWRTAMSIIRANKHTLEDLDYYAYILEGESDDVRCERFFERDSYKPAFIFHFLLRQSSSFSHLKTLDQLIDYCHKRCINVSRTEEEESKFRYGSSKWAMSPADFNFVMRLLVYHCLRLEPRFVINLGEIASRFIGAIEDAAIPDDEIYQIQCLVFNANLALFEPNRRLQAIQRSSPNAFFWEAQRILLAKSVTLKRSLLVDRNGFRAIRNSLSSQAKDYAEIRSSSRHSSTWPPYLRPGDGMDEVMDPEENWGRAVRAGMLMQEAGFSKEEQDDAIDILQGMTPDGTPSIQQRVSIAQWRDVSEWEASIRATRNAEEAWERFRNPPKAGKRPGATHYAAMFEKLVLRDVEPGAGLMPGDKALNFPTQQEANLTEFEKARLRPPSVSQLYEQFRLQGLRPRDNCLRILVANAESLDTANRYILDSNEDYDFHHLVTADPPIEVLKKIDINLFSSYVQVIMRQESKRTRKYLMRAIDLLEKRLGNEQTIWSQFTWGLILKNLSQHHRGLRVHIDQQVKLVLHVVHRLDGPQGIPLSVFAQFTKCIRKIFRREVDEVWPTVEAGTVRENNSVLSFLRRQTTAQQRGMANAARGEESPPTLFDFAATRLKQVFRELKTQEKETEQLLGANQVAALDRMAWRRDPVRSEHAYQYMLSLAYVGEFQEMASLLRWLIHEWGQPEVVEALSEVDELPPHADFFETMCAFRLLAEPMLDPRVVDSLQEAIGAARLSWVWPDDEAVEAYAQVQEDESIHTLARTLEWIRHRQRHGQQRDEKAETFVGDFE